MNATTHTNEINLKEVTEPPVQQEENEQDIDSRIQYLIHRLSNSLKTTVNSPENIAALNQLVKKGKLVEGLEQIDQSPYSTDQTTYKILMKLMKQEKRKSELQEGLFALIKIEGKLDPDICATHLKIYGERLEFQKAKQVFDNCIKFLTVNETLYSSYIRVCGQCNEMQEMETVIEAIDNKKKFSSPLFTLHALKPTFKTWKLEKLKKSLTK